MIANEAVILGTFGKSFKMDRMTWIKPSFLWMMYRSGWATKDGQNRILAIDMKRDGFDYIVNNAVLSSYSAEAYGSHEEWKEKLQGTEVRCQWDPERDIYGNPLNQRTIQLGIKGSMSHKYVHDWIIKLTDITQNVIDIKEAIEGKTFTKAMLPIENKYTIHIDK